MMESRKVAVLLLVVAIALSLIALTVTLGVDNQPARSGAAGGQVKAVDSTSGQVEFEVLPSNGNGGGK